jgi:small ligand-binding sensory domain FIST
VAWQIEVGDLVSFAVRDPAAAREGLTEAARRAERQALGSAPTFAIYLSCAGRGRSLYGEPDGDVRILRRCLPKIPIAGMHSAFEIVPWSDGTARMQLMSGVIALFRAAS